MEARTELVSASAIEDLVLAAAMRIRFLENNHVTINTAQPDAPLSAMVWMVCSEGPHDGRLGVQA